VPGLRKSWHRLDAVTERARYLEAPAAEEAAAAAVVVAASVQPGFMRDALGDPLLPSTPSLDLIKLTEAALHRLSDAADNEWLELWQEAGEEATVLGNLSAVGRVLSTADHAAPSKPNRGWFRRK